MLFAYFGPETFLPLTSVIAGVVGVALMFGKNAFRLMLIPFKKLAKKQQHGQSAPGAHAMPPAPHFDTGADALAKRRAKAAARAATSEQEKRD